MNKAIALLLASVLCLSLCACGGGELTPPVTEETTDPIPDETEGEAIVLYDEEEGYPFVNQARLGEIVEEVELTTENWMDYIGVCTYTEELVEKDAFDEIISTETIPHSVLGVKLERYYYLRDFAIELKDSATGETTIYEGRFSEVPEDFDLAQYECTRIKGTAYLIDVPEEAIWQGTLGNEAVTGFTVRYSDYSYGPPMSYYLRGWGIEGEFRYVLY